MQIYIIALIFVILVLLAIILLARYKFSYYLEIKTFLNSMPSMAYVKDKNNKFVTANKEFLDFFKIGKTELKGKTDSEIGLDRIFNDIESDENVIISGKAVLNYETKVQIENNEIKWFSISKSPLYGFTGSIKGMVNIIQDITNLKSIESKLNYISNYDTATTLPNRTHFINLVKREIEKNYKSQKELSILYFEIDQLTTITNTVEYDSIQNILLTTSSKIQNLCKNYCLLGSIGENKFAIAHTKNDDDSLEKLISNILEIFNESYLNSLKSCIFYTNIGISQYPKDGINPDILLKNAEIAMKESKKDGKNKYTHYKKYFTQKALDKSRLEKNLELAVQENQFVLHYQPLVSVKTNEILGYEALVRWQKPGSGFVSPDNFIPLAEETGLIVPLGDWVLGAACSQSKIWSNKLFPSKIAVNISTVQFYKDNLISTIHKTLENSKIHPSQLEIEVTESMIMQDQHKSIRILKQLREMGITVAIDDFGTGYSSLGYLKDLPINKLKIDKAFIKDLKKGSDDEKIVKAIVSLSKELGLRIIAEGVENEEQLDLLYSYGCDEVQGYLFSKPISAEEVEKIVCQLSECV